MKYLLMVYANEKAFLSFSPEDQARGMEAYMAYAEALRKAGAINRARCCGASRAGSRSRSAGRRVR